MGENGGFNQAILKPLLSLLAQPCLPFRIMCQGWAPRGFRDSIVTLLGHRGLLSIFVWGIRRVARSVNKTINSWLVSEVPVSPHAAAAFFLLSCHWPAADSSSSLPWSGPQGSCGKAFNSKTAHVLKELVRPAGSQPQCEASKHLSLFAVSYSDGSVKSYWMGKDKDFPLKTFGLLTWLFLLFDFLGCVFIVEIEKLRDSY